MKNKLILFGIILLLSIMTVSYVSAVCTTPYDDVLINTTAEGNLCNGTYYINDIGGNGVVIVNAHNLSIVGNNTFILGLNLSNSLPINTSSKEGINLSYVYFSDFGNNLMIVGKNTIFNNVNFTNTNTSIRMTSAGGQVPSYFKLINSSLNLMDNNKGAIYVGSGSNYFITLNCSNSLIYGRNTGNGFTSYNDNSITIDGCDISNYDYNIVSNTASNFTLINSRLSSGNYSISFLNMSNITIRNVIVNDSQNSGGLFSCINNLNISNSSFSNSVEEHGIYLDVKYNQTASPYCGINADIYNSNFIGNEGAGIHINGGPVNSSSNTYKNISIHDNYFDNPSGVGIIDQAGFGTIITRNIFKDFRAIIFGSDNNYYNYGSTNALVYNNLFNNISSYTYWITHTSKNSSIYNNTYVNMTNIVVRVFQIDSETQYADYSLNFNETTTVPVILRLNITNIPYVYWNYNGRKQFNISNNVGKFGDVITLINQQLAFPYNDLRNQSGVLAYNFDNYTKTLNVNELLEVGDFMGFSNVAVQVSSNNVVVSWLTSRFSNSSIGYGVGGLSSIFGLNDNVSSHSLSLNDLVGSSTYLFNLTSCDSIGCKSSGLYSFITGSPTIISQVSDDSLIIQSCIDARSGVVRALSEFPTWFVLMFIVLGAAIIIGAALYMINRSEVLGGVSLESLVPALIPIVIAGFFVVLGILIMSAMC